MDVEAGAPAAVLADAHLGTETAHRIEDFLELLHHLPHPFSSLILLGDLFDFWVGVRGRFPSHQEQVIRGIRAARARGAAVYYVEGNRDYAIANIDGGHLFDRVFSDEAAFKVGGARLLLTHGDMINLKDWRYRTWRRISRHVLAPMALRVLPASPLLKMASRLERRLRGTNAAGRRGFPRQGCEVFAARGFSRGYDAVIVGHFHREEAIAVNGHGAEKRLFCVPSWRESGRVLVVDREGGVTFS